jgi:hypothetical protein
MIQIEDELFTTIATALRSAYTGIYVTGEYVNQPPKLPAVFIVEQDNSIYQRGVDSGDIENFAEVMYQVDVFSNKNKGRKAECKAIIGAVDEQFNRLGFTRTFLNPVPNMNDATIYRMTARYRGVVSKDKLIYGR